MAKRNRTAPRARRAKPSPDLDAILGRFNDARCILECAVRSLEAWHDATTGTDDEASCLRHGLDLLGAVYDQLDLAIPAMRDSDHA